MRVVSYNIHGAFVPGKASHQTQDRSWHRLAALGADLALVQEVDEAAVLPWVHGHWSVVAGTNGQHGKSQGWGSVIAARTKVNLRPRDDLFEDRWLKLLYDYVMVGEIDLPDGSPAVVASVHAPAVTVAKLLEYHPDALHPTGDELETMAQPGDEAWALDLAFEALDRNLQGGRFIIGGDWNNSRLFDSKPRDGRMTSTLFFTRAARRGWFECGAGQNEERTFLKPDTAPYQLDHLFCDATTAAGLEHFQVDRSDGLDELSDHAPVLMDLAY